MRARDDDVRRYLRGTSYPASKEEVSSAAELAGAPDDLVERIEAVEQGRFASPDEVLVALTGSPLGIGRSAPRAAPKGGSRR